MSIRRPLAQVAAGPSTHRPYYLALAGITVMVLLDLAVNLLMLNPGEPDVLTILGFARGLVHFGAWPGNPYFPPGYPLLLIPFGYLGSMLVGGYLLSALGLWLGLWAVYRLSLTLGLSLTGAFAAAALCWLMPITRYVVTSPHVDSLFNGLAVWFIAAAISFWCARSQTVQPAGWHRLQRWVIVGMLLPALLLPLLRNHAAVLVLPVLIALACCHRKRWRLPAAAAALFIAAVVFIQLSYWAAYGQLQPNVWQTYYRVGLELDYHKFAASNEAICNDYAELAERSRSVPLLADYSLQQVAVHSARQFWLFFRRPAVMLAVILGLLAPLLASRLGLWRSLPGALAPAAWWVLLYSLALSPAYFNARNCAPQVFIGAAVVTTVIGTFASTRIRRSAWVVLGLALLLFDALYFPDQVYTRFYLQHKAGSAVEQYVSARGLAYSDVVVDGIVLLPLRDNRWCELYSMVKAGWRNDPVIRAEQLALLKQYDSAKLARGEGELPALFICPDPPERFRTRLITESPYWQKVAEIAGTGIYSPTRAERPADETSRSP